MAGDIFTPNKHRIVDVLGLTARGRQSAANGLGFTLSTEDLAKLEEIRAAAAAPALATGAATDAKLVDVHTALIDVQAEVGMTNTALALLQALFPATIGQKAMAESLAVAISGDQSPVPVDANSYVLLSDWLPLNGTGSSVQILGPRTFNLNVVDLRKDAPTTSGSTSQNVQIGGYTGSTVRRLLLFTPSLADYDTYAVEDATVYLWDQNHTTATDDSVGPVQFFRVLPAASNAGENDVSWNYRSIASTQAWAGGPGMAAGTDYSTTQMGVRQFNEYSGASVPYLFDVPLDVTEFNLLRSSNNGIIAKLQNESAINPSTVRFTSDEGLTVAERPYMVVTFRPPELADIPLSRVKEVYLQAEGEDIFVSNGLSASASNLRLKNGQVIRQKLSVDGTLYFSALVPSGATLKYQFAGLPS